MQTAAERAAQEMNFKDFHPADMKPTEIDEYLWAFRKKAVSYLPPEYRGKYVPEFGLLDDPNRIVLGWFKTTVE